MPNPTTVAIPAGTWTKVATSVTRGYVRIIDHSKDYLHTYLLTGEVIPDVNDRSIGAVFEGTAMEIATFENTDIYIWCSQGGAVRVDL